MFGIRRREFITLLGGAAAGWPLAGWAQPSVRVRRIGIFMNLASVRCGRTEPQLAAFLQGLQELGWAVGRNVRIDYRWGASNSDPVTACAKTQRELLALAPDVVLATTAPIVGGAAAGEPDGSDRLRDCHRPGGRGRGRQPRAAGR